MTSVRKPLPPVLIQCLPQQVWELLAPQLPNGAPPRAHGEKHGGPRAQDERPPDNPTHPGGRPRADSYRAANAIYFVMSSGAQWKFINKEVFGVSKSTAHTYFQYWRANGVFIRTWATSLLAYDRTRGIDFSFQAMDASMVKAPLGGDKTGPNPTDRGKLGSKRSILDEGRGIPISITLDSANTHDCVLFCPHRPESDPLTPFC